jgi:hypothetical protein
MFKDIDYLIKNNYISRRKHPSENLFILNYTAKTQYEEFWNETTESCRGLIVDEDYNIKARCFKKFFNYEQVLDKIDELINQNKKFETTEKLDGSLGILYWIKGKPFIATRGSFESEQSIRANSILYKKYNHVLNQLDKDKTYLFEIIYPENKIVVNYGSQENLILIGIIDNKTGQEYDIHNTNCIFAKVKKYDIENCNFQYLKSLNKDNSEGFVIKSECGFRFKIKFSEYVRLHKLIFGINSKIIWESLKNKKELNLDEIPDEVYNWVKSIKDRLNKNYKMVEDESIKIYEQIKTDDRKIFAQCALEYKYHPILFKMLDKKPYDFIIWKILEPEFERPTAS